MLLSLFIPAFVRLKLPAAEQWGNESRETGMSSTGFST